MEGSKLVQMDREKVGGGTCHNDKPGLWGCKKDGGLVGVKWEGKVEGTEMKMRGSVCVCERSGRICEDEGR